MQLAELCHISHLLWAESVQSLSKADVDLREGNSVSPPGAISFDFFTVKSMERIGHVILDGADVPPHLRK